MFGNGFGMMSSEKVLATKTTPGFMKPFNDISMKGDSDVHGITGDTRLGVSATNYLFQRESHDKNAKIGNGFKAKNNIEYSRIAIVVHPNEEYYGEDSGTDYLLRTPHLLSLNPQVQRLRRQRNVQRCRESLSLELKSSTYRE